MMMAGSGQYLSVPPGFRFHPTEEELLSYYLRKKVSYEDIDLDVIREVDINRLEPWDIKERCRVGSGPQNEWYFFSHKDKKYPTGSRTNRATQAGFWKATGRDKVILLGNSSRRIGTRKTLVFYTGRAPNGQKTDWIMHEYRLHEDHPEVKEEGWVVCRVFQKKSHLQHSFVLESCLNEEESQQQWRPIAPVAAAAALQQRPHLQMPCNYFFSGNSVLRLPQLLSPDAALQVPCLPPFNFQNEADCSEYYRNPMKTTTPAGGGGGGVLRHEEQLLSIGDPTVLDRLLESHQNLDQIFKGEYCNIIGEKIAPQALTGGGSSGLAPIDDDTPSVAFSRTGG